MQLARIRSRLARVTQLYAAETNRFTRPNYISLPAASGRVHIIDDVCQRCGAGEHKRPLPVDSRQRAGAVAQRHHVALSIAPGEDALATIPERAAVNHGAM